MYMSERSNMRWSATSFSFLRNVERASNFKIRVGERIYGAIFEVIFRLLPARLVGKKSRT